MSHRDDCPDRWTARRQGERDYENRGHRSYSDPYECDEANRAYHDAQRSAMYKAEREQERREEASREQHRREYMERDWEEMTRQEQEEHEYYEGLAEAIEAAVIEAQGDGP